MKLQVPVKSRHIKAGIHGDPYRCPLALAIADAMRRTRNVEIRDTSIVIKDEKGRTYAARPRRDDLDWIRRFDCGVLTSEWIIELRLREVKRASKPHAAANGQRFAGLSSGLQRRGYPVERPAGAGIPQARGHVAGPSLVQQLPSSGLREEPRGRRRPGSRSSVRSSQRRRRYGRPGRL
jgi:hypothetical protein